MSRHSLSEQKAILSRDCWQERFWSNACQIGDDECWLWNSNLNPDGYGRFGLNNDCFLAHRISFLLSGRELQLGEFVCHSCDNPSCVNPKHLFGAPPIGNVRDMMQKGRRPLGSDCHNAILSPCEVLEIRILYPQAGVSFLSRMYGVARSTIYGILSGKNWKHLTT